MLLQLRSRHDYNLLSICFQHFIGRKALKLVGQGSDKYLLAASVYHSRIIYKADLPMVTKPVLVLPNSVSKVEAKTRQRNIK